MGAQRARFHQQCNDVIAFILAAALSVPPNVDNGANLFRARCSSCHGLNLQGGPQGPPLLAVDASDVDYMLRTGRMPAENPWEQEFHKTPVFTQAQIDALIAYVMSKSTGDKAILHPLSSGDIRSGRLVYAENCEHCHSATGRGESAGYRNLAPSLMDSSPQVVAEAVRIGPDVMPKFGEQVIDQKHLADLTAYIRWLQTDKYNPGGVQLSNWGPISEGFIAWVFGIGLLMLLTRRIETGE